MLCLMADAIRGPVLMLPLPRDQICRVEWRWRAPHPRDFDAQKELFSPVLSSYSGRVYPLVPCAPSRLTKIFVSVPSHIPMPSYSYPTSPPPESNRLRLALLGCSDPSADTNSHSMPGSVHLQMNKIYE